MTFITWACLRCVQELVTILGPENPTQRRSAMQIIHFRPPPLLHYTVQSGTESQSDQLILAALNDSLEAGHQSPDYPGEISSAGHAAAGAPWAAARF